MKRIIIFSTALLIGFALTSLSSKVNAQTTTQKKVTTEQPVAKKYTCPMHPEVMMDKPGKCPKCGMTLVEKTDIKEGGMNKMHDMKNMHKMKNMNDTTMMKHDSTKMKKCCMIDDQMDMKTIL
jgi:hypothetical protein